ncbi:MAG TPA: hypothetical protein VEA59_03050 [Patescibacteria group bacterium]|nr:hypothetical protein [Patescibacteria group bacterium]
MNASDRKTTGSEDAEGFNFETLRKLREELHRFLENCRSRRPPAKPLKRDERRENIKTWDGPGHAA